MQKPSFPLPAKTECITRQLNDCTKVFGVALGE